jgi:hypothetical protein
MAEDVSPVGGIIGFFVGMLIAAGFYFGCTMALGLKSDSALIVAAVAAVIGAAYAAVAFSKKVYTAGPLSIIGFVLDSTWSLLNSLAGLLVWIPACKIKGANFVNPDDDSQRSGTFVYDANPRGGPYGATTIGPVIAGGWSSHEETHVWQARIFGPAYLISYGVALVLNIPFRAITTNTENLTMEAYYRVPFEDWAYWAGETSGGDINAGGWLLGFLLALIYTGSLISIPVGIALGILPLWLGGIGVLVAYSLIRAFAPSGH